MTPVITFLSDFGLTDSHIGICRAVIAGIAPDATVIDLVHTIPAADVLGGAAAAYQLRDPRWHREPVSPVLRGRDVCGPVAAHAASGVRPSAFGPAVAVGDLRTVDAVRLGDG